MNGIASITPSIFQDQYGRNKRKLRISVTDRCNFKCVYCMPEHPEWMKKQDLLSFEALYQFCDFMVQNGIEKIRITGGEPLMRLGVVHFIRDLQKLRHKGLKRISITTNAHYLAKYAHDLKLAGLDDLNISLDSLDPEQFLSLTKKKLKPVLDGIAAVQAVDLPFKINTVLMKGKNDDQILPMVNWANQHNISLRFIEFMPLDGDQKWTQADVVTEQDILKTLSNQFHIQELKQEHEPARLYRLNGEYEVGIISTISHSFCGECDRIRLTAQGELYNCLFATQGLMLKPLLNQLVSEKDEKIRQFVQQTLYQQTSAYIWRKAKGFHSLNQQSRKISMHMLGG
ncbi:GTP 3',8-cyclase MoaA [Acinetobacter sp. S40]|uniref:GTP 3',8-cyclase MoaA n=1 Tax=Acinetobacter sp. S40 TaxID=2767434 RepID=UPI00190C4A68|nr:GTP 3',8-cyclase MoaA [Acinetobacter sp. S40]MBJ9985198.1 GTP 3',8-cyclase MoaA [Acinetobacter sp. S40]